jgi:prolyl 4-hydroxylase
LLHDFLTAAECDELVALALPELEASTVVDTATGGGFLSQVRTSSGMFIMENTPVTKVIRQRIAHLTLLPGMQRTLQAVSLACSRQPFTITTAAEENQEAISVLQYKARTLQRDDYLCSGSLVSAFWHLQVGQYYRPHQDFFGDATNINRGGQRVATVLMYLSDVEQGGETTFPSANPKQTAQCGRTRAKGISVQPRKGNAVLFFTTTPDGEEDYASMHGSCEVIQGIKYSATMWIRSGVFT